MTTMNRRRAEFPWGSLLAAGLSAGLVHTLDQFRQAVLPASPSLCLLLTVPLAIAAMTGLRSVQVVIGALVVGLAVAGLPESRSASEVVIAVATTGVSVLVVLGLVGHYGVSYRRARRDADHDPMTGLANRRAVVAGGQRLIDRAHAESKALAVVVLDCDRFKAINDRFGHAAGDSVLRDISTAMTEVARPDDLVCRLGGDEFVAVLFDADPMAAHQFVGRVQARLMRTAKRLKAPVEVSAGVAISGRDGERILDLINRADDRMYRRKGLARAYDTAVVEASGIATQGV